MPTSPTVSQVEVDGQVAWEARPRCTNCQVEIILRSEEKPNRIALGVSTRMVCDACETAIEAAEEETRTKQRVRERVERSELPSDLQGFYWNEMVGNEGRKFVVEQIRKWAGEHHPEPRAIYLYGSNGRGKTRLAATAAHSRLHYWDARWVSMPILLAKLGAAFSDAARRDAIKVLTGKGALVLDDLDKTSPSDWAATQVFAAIDTRIQAGAPLLITANLRPDRLGEKFKGEIGASIMSRVSGMHVLELPGQDARLTLDAVQAQAEEEAAREALPEPEEKD